MYTNLEGGEVRVEAEVEEIEVEKTKDGFLCPLSGTGTTTGTYTGDTDASGTHEEEPTGISVVE
jgi:phytoene dehydrogenase-like protein